MDLEIAKTLNQFFKSQPVLKAWVFGSFARGEENEASDIDLLVIFDPDKEVSLLDHIGIQLELEDLLGRQVDLVTEGCLTEAAKKTADFDKIKIYERSA